MPGCDLINARLSTIPFSEKSILIDHGSSADNLQFSAREPKNQIAVIGRE